MSGLVDANRMLGAEEPKDASPHEVPSASAGDNGQSVIMPPSSPKSDTPCASAMNPVLPAEHAIAHSHDLVAPAPMPLPSAADAAHAPDVLNTDIAAAAIADVQADVRTTNASAAQSSEALPIETHPATIVAGNTALEKEAPDPVSSAMPPATIASCNTVIEKQAVAHVLSDADRSVSEAQGAPTPLVAPAPLSVQEESVQEESAAGTELKLGLLPDELDTDVQCGDATLEKPDTPAPPPSPHALSTLPNAPAAADRALSINPADELSSDSAAHSTDSASSDAPRSAPALPAEAKTHLLTETKGVAAPREPLAPAEIKVQPVAAKSAAPPPVESKRGESSKAIHRSTTWPVHSHPPGMAVGSVVRLRNRAHGMLLGAFESKSAATEREGKSAAAARSADGLLVVGCEGGEAAHYLYAPRRNGFLDLPAAAFVGVTRRESMAVTLAVCRERAGAPLCYSIRSADGRFLLDARRTRLVCSETEPSMLIPESAQWELERVGQVPLTHGIDPILRLAARQTLFMRSGREPSANELADAAEQLLSGVATLDSLTARATVRSPLQRFVRALCGESTPLALTPADATALAARPSTLLTNVLRATNAALRWEDAGVTFGARRDAAELDLYREAMARRATSTTVILVGTELPTESARSTRAVRVLPPEPTLDERLVCGRMIAVTEHDRRHCAAWLSARPASNVLAAPELVRVDDERAREGALRARTQWLGSSSTKMVFFWQGAWDRAACRGAVKEFCSAFPGQRDVLLYLNIAIAAVDFAKEADGLRAVFKTVPDKNIFASAEFPHVVLNFEPYSASERASMLYWCDVALDLSPARSLSSGAAEAKSSTEASNKVGARCASTAAAMRVAYERHAAGAIGGIAWADALRFPAAPQYERIVCVLGRQRPYNARVRPESDYWASWLRGMAREVVTLRITDLVSPDECRRQAARLSVHESAAAAWLALLRPDLVVCSADVPPMAMPSTFNKLVLPTDRYVLSGDARDEQAEAKGVLFVNTYDAQLAVGARATLLQTHASAEYTLASGHALLIVDGVPPSALDGASAVVLAADSDPFFLADAMALSLPILGPRPADTGHGPEAALRERFLSDVALPIA